MRVGGGSGGGVKLVAVGVQFQPDPSRQAKGGFSRISQQKQAEMNTFFCFCFIQHSLCKVISWLSTGL